jgi:hypothetical protein
VLSTCNHEAVTEHADGDPLERWKTYGSIHNPHIQVWQFLIEVQGGSADATVAKDPQECTSSGCCIRT